MTKVEPLEIHEHEFILMGTLERFDRKHVTVVYQCMTCNQEIIELEPLPSEEWDQEE